MRMTEEQVATHQKRIKGAGSSTVEPLPSKQNIGVRFPASAPKLQKRKGPNKTEAAFGEWLRGYGWGSVEFESHTLRMPGGTRYTPDWVSADKLEIGVNICFWEVKGFMREAARVRLKEFAAHFTMFRFFLVRAKDRSLTSWDIQEL